MLMETERMSSSERVQPPSNVILFNSVGGNLAKNLGIIEYNRTETGINLSKTHSTLNISKMKNDFLPFLHERDGLNRLLTVPSKYDPSKIEMPSNPSLYYKADRFNKLRLRFGQAERNDHALGKLLKYTATQEGIQNILELNRNARMKRLQTQTSKFTATTKNDRWLIEAIEEDDPDVLDADIVRNSSPQFEPLKSDSPQRKVLTEGGSPTPFGEIRTSKNKTKNEQWNHRNIQKRPNTQSNVKVKSEPNLKKPFFQPSDDFCNFYKKLDNDVRTIATSSTGVRNKTKEDLHYLNHITKRYERMQKQEKKKDVPPSLTSLGIHSYRINEEDYRLHINSPPGEKKFTSKNDKPKVKQNYFLSPQFEIGKSFLKKRFTN